MYQTPLLRSYNQLTRVYYRNALGAFVVFDATRPKTFDNVRLLRVATQVLEFVAGAETWSRWLCGRRTWMIK